MQWVINFLFSQNRRDSVGVYYFPSKIVFNREGFNSVVGFFLFSENASEAQSSSVQSSWCLL